MTRICSVLLGMSLCVSISWAQDAKHGKESSTGGSRDEPSIQLPPPEPGPATPGSADVSPVPHTEMNDSSITRPSADPLLDPAPLPKGEVTLIGGIAKKVDRVRNRIHLQPFGEKRSVSVLFDDRTHIFRDGRETTILALHPGDRVYLDTQTIGPSVFARNVRVQSKSASAHAVGQIVEVDQSRSAVTMTDSLTRQTVSFRVTPQTAVRGTSSAADYLRPGTVVSVAFSPVVGGRGEAEEVEVLAVPGMTFTFAGRVTYIDLRTGTVAVDNDSDRKNYQLQFDAAKAANHQDLKVGSTIAAKTTFDGRQYLVQSLSVLSPPVAAER